MPKQRTVKNKKIYLGGGMLNRGEILQRTEEKEALLSLGYDLYNPVDNKEINDKENLDSDAGLAEKIVRADTKALMESDIVVIEPRNETLGTIAEVGQLVGMRDVAQKIKNVLHSPAAVEDICNKILNQKIYPHNSDIRRLGNPSETGDRRSYGDHQYKYGCVLKLTNGHGYYTFEEILEELENA